MSAAHHVRPALPADAAELVRLAELMYTSVELACDDAWRESALRQVGSRLAGDDLWGWVIDADAEYGGSGPGGRLASSGLVNLNPRLAIPGMIADARGFVQWVCTDTEYRGRGYAKAIMQRILDDSDERGIEVLELLATPAARSLYLSLSFVYWPPVDYPADVRGVPMQRRAPRGADSVRA